MARLGWTRTRPIPNTAGQKLVVEYRGGIQIVRADSDVAREAADLVGGGRNLSALGNVSHISSSLYCRGRRFAVRKQTPTSCLKSAVGGYFGGSTAGRHLGKVRGTLSLRCQPWAAESQRCRRREGSSHFLRLPRADAMLNYLWRQPAFGLWLTFRKDILCLRTKPQMLHQSQQLRLPTWLKPSLLRKPRKTP